MRKFSLHFLFWIVFFLMWNRIMYFYISNNINRVYFSALDVSLVVSAFYIIYLYVMPDYLERKSVGRLVGLTILLIILLAGIYSWIMWVFLQKNLVSIHFVFSWNYKDLQYNRFFIALLGVLAGCFAKLAVDRREVGRRMEIMEKEKSVAELTYLKAQLNPHFLFNSLNNLYTQLESSAEEAQGTLASLADLLRYQLYECNADFISVAKEFAYLKNYFNLQSIRKDNCCTDLLIKETEDELVIAPLLLIPFVENAFKYVSDHDGQENFIKIKIDFTGRQLNFFCSNTIEAFHRQSTGTMDKGIGLLNVKKRLDLIYEDNYRLQTGLKNGLYDVVLTIIL